MISHKIKLKYRLIYGPLSQPFHRKSQRGPLDQLPLHQITLDWIALHYIHYISLRRIAFRTLKVNIIIILYMCECVPRPGNLWSQMKPGGMDTAGFELETPNQFDMKDHGSCIQSAPNSLIKQIQLQLASFRARPLGTHPKLKQFRGCFCLNTSSNLHSKQL